MRKKMTKHRTAFWVGFFEAILQLPRVIKTRNKMKRMFIMSDSEILSGFK